MDNDYESNDFGYVENYTEPEDNSDTGILLSSLKIRNCCAVCKYADKGYDGKSACNLMKKIVNSNGKCNKFSSRLYQDD